jgi:hypothetical protein
MVHNIFHCIENFDPLNPCKCNNINIALPIFDTIRKFDTNQHEIKELGLMSLISLIKWVGI